VKIQGEFVWHSHADTDEVFIVVDGAMTMTIHFRDGVEHRPSADAECKLLLVEPAGTLNTGDVQSTLTAEDGVWV